MNPLGISYGQTAGVGGQAGLAQIVKGADLNPFEIYQKGQAQLAGVEAQRIKAKQDIDKQDGDTLKDLQQKTLEYDFTDKKAVDGMTQELYEYAKEYKSKNPYKALSTDPEFQKKYMNLQNTYRASKDASDEYKRIMEMKQTDSPWIDIEAMKNDATAEMNKGVNDRNVKAMNDINNPKYFSRNRAATDLLAKIKDGYKNGDATIKQGNFGIETVTTDGSVRFLGDDGKPGVSTNLARYLLSEPAYARKIEADIKSVVNTEIQDKIAKGDNRNRQDIENEVILSLSPDGMNGLMIEQAKKDAMVHQQIANKKEVKNDASILKTQIEEQGKNLRQAKGLAAGKEKERKTVLDRHNLLVATSKGDRNTMSRILQNMDSKDKKVTFNTKQGQFSGNVVGISSQGERLGQATNGFKEEQNKGYIYIKTDEGKIKPIEFDNNIENNEQSFYNAINNVIESTLTDKSGFGTVNVDDLTKASQEFGLNEYKGTELDNLTPTQTKGRGNNVVTPTKKTQPENKINEKQARSTIF